MEGEKRYSYIRKKWAKGSIGAIISSILSFCLFFLCLGISFYQKGKAPVVVGAIALLSVNFLALSLRFALPIEQGKFIERRPVYIVLGVDIFLLFIWLALLFLGFRM